MQEKKISVLDILLSKLVSMLKFKLMIISLVVGLIAFGTIVDNFDPVPPETYKQLEIEERARAKAEGRLPDSNRFLPFDNFSVANYLLPLFAIWMMCKFARRRKRLPASYFATVCLVVMVLWFGDWMLTSLDIGRLAAAKPVAGILAGLVLVWFGAIWLYRLPNRIDPLLRGAAVLGYSAFGRAERSYSSEAARRWLYVSSLAFAPMLWMTYDWIDGGAIPGPFALTVRSLFVVFSLWLMGREQIDLSWPVPALSVEDIEARPDLDLDLDDSFLDL